MSVVESGLVLPRILHGHFARQATAWDGMAADRCNWCRASSRRRRRGRLPHRRTREVESKTVAKIFIKVFLVHCLMTRLV